MKTILRTLCLAALVLTACQRRDLVTRVDERPGDRAVTFRVSGISTEVGSRTSVIAGSADLDAFSVVAFRLQDGERTVAWRGRALRAEGDVYVCNKYWPRQIPAGVEYAFYASNLPDSCLHVTGEGVALTYPDCGTDWMEAGSQAYTGYAAAVPIVFDHLLARIADVYMGVPEGFDVVVDSMSVTGFTRSVMTEDGPVYSAPVTQVLRQTGVVTSTGQVITFPSASNDVWVMPGTVHYVEDGQEYAGCKLSVAFTLKKGEWSDSRLAETSLALNEGEVARVTVNVSAATGFGVSITQWKERTDTTVEL